MSGYVKLHRGWRDNAIFRGEFSRADAWVWLIEHAAWKPAKARIKGQPVELARGELSFSVRFMAAKWGWSKSRVDRFLAELEAENMVKITAKSRDNSGTTTGTTAGHPAGQGASIISLCNYDKYQGRDDTERDNAQSESGTSAFQNRDEEEEGKKGKKEETTHYAFFGRTVRLNANDLDRWRNRYSAIADLEAELGSLDDWLSGQDEKTRGNWFHIVSGSLNKKHQAAKAAANDDGDAMANFIA